MIHVSVETLAAWYQSPLGIYSNSLSSSTRHLLQLYSTNIWGSEWVFFWTNMTHVSVETLAVWYQSPLGIYSNSPSSSPVRQPIQLYSTDMPVQRWLMEYVLTIIQSVGGPPLKSMDPWRCWSSWLTPYDSLQPYLHNQFAKHGHMGLYQLRIKSTFEFWIIRDEVFVTTLYNIVHRRY